MRRLVSAVCDVDEDERSQVAKDAASRVTDKTKASWSDLERLRDDASSKINEVLADANLKDRHEEAKKLSAVPAQGRGTDCARPARCGGQVARKRAARRVLEPASMTNASTFKWITSFVLACTAGCVTGVELLDEGTAGSELIDTAFWRRAALLTVDGTAGTRYCTGTIIGDSRVLTAASCDPRIGDRVLFYPGPGLLVDETSDRIIESIHNLPGVNGRIGDLTESGGDFADLTIVRLGEHRPTGTRVATAAWTYPAGGDDWGEKVVVASSAELEVLGDLTYSDHDNDGHFLTENQQTEDGDKGGPFYYKDRVLGVLHGPVWEWERRDKYASAAERIDFIVGNIGFVWSGGITVSGRRLSGTVMEMFTGAWPVCQYACQQTYGCLGVSRKTSTGTCRLFSSLGAPVSDLDFVAAER
jgi:hypothetical protein